ncbi:ABC transporter permease [Gordonia sp. WA4-43]|uniref:ABC transporter permease n=1 Tax=Gordonia sp. WA4-43 TaxID=2878678 RepID=UPI001CFA3FBF|nr:ABC transporter permease [Gordonia sp. WA4-43]UCZ92572.1 ABC transporter permease [Gordonia sp. WA4-43]
MSAAAGQVRRAAIAELTRVGGARSVLWFGLIPGAVLLPLAITFGVATVAERFASISGSIQVTSVGTTNSVYWVITFTVMIWAVVAAFAHATAERGPLGELSRHLFPRRWTVAVGRWLTYGLGAALCCGILVAIVMAALPALFPTVYGGVELTSAEGVRFLLTVPTFAVFAVGIGLGLAGLIGHPAGTVVVLLGWAYVVENAISLIPNGYTLQSYMPFLNGTYGTGQELAFVPPWGPTGGLVFCGAVSVVMFTLGCAATAMRVTRTGSRGWSSAVRAARAERRPARPFG